MTRGSGLTLRFVVASLALLFVATGVGLAAQGSGTQPAQAPPAKVNINKATVQQLQDLPGIGPAIARRIVEYREQNGPFKRIEELMNVRGIGARKFARLRDRITV